MASSNNDRTDSLQYISNLEEDLKLSAEIGAALLSENEEMKQQTLDLWTELDQEKAAFQALQVCASCVACVRRLLGACECVHFAKGKRSDSC